MVKKDKQTNEQSNSNSVNRNFQIAPSTNGNGKQMNGSNNKTSERKSARLKQQELENLIQFLPDSIMPHLKPLHFPFLKFIEHINQLEGQFFKTFSGNQSLIAKLVKFLDKSLGKKKRTKKSKQKENFGFKILKSGLRRIGTFLEQSQSILTGGNKKKIESLQTENQKLKEQIKGQNIMIREINHRVKNHIQILIGHMSVKMRSSTTVSEQNTLTSFETTLKSFKNFYQMIDFTPDENGEFNVNKYYRKLMNQLTNTLPKKIKKKVNFCINSDQFPIEHVIPVSLIINELVMNSIQHGFDDHQTPEVMISLKNHNNSAVLSVSDQGKGFNKVAQDLDNAKGIQLVEKLAEEQLGGTLMNEDSETGTSWTIKFPIHA